MLRGGAGARTVPQRRARFEGGVKHRRSRIANGRAKRQRDDVITSW